MGEALYRKYRPKKFSEVVGQDHITTTIKNALNTNKVSHGYLLSGPRGVGKTSVARIIAREINGISHNDDKENLDVIEIDAASNRRIDEIRELREKVNIAPAQGLYKVYIIDEVHMLTREAFNALLKTLEEPPKHAVFILATTEAHKLPPTIISRTQHFTFKPVSQETVSNHLMEIAKTEKLALDKEAADLIAHSGDGSFRDSISLLDQLSSKQTITEQDVLELIGSPPNETIEQLQSAALSGDLQTIHQLLKESAKQGYLAEHISVQLIETFKKSIISDVTGDNSSSILDVSRQLLIVANSPQPYQELELILLDFALPNNTPQAEGKPKKVETPQKKAPESQAKSKPKSRKSEPNSKNKITEKPQETPSDSSKLWDAVLSELKSKHITLYGVARMATATIDSNTLNLAVTYGFHRDKLSDSKNLQLLSDIISTIYSKPLDVHVTVREGEKNSVEAVVHQEDPVDSHNAVTAIFGGGEVLET